MEKKDWMQTFAEAESAESVWCENVAGDVRGMSVQLPESGRYRVIFVKLDGVPERRQAPGAANRRNISPGIRALRGAAKPMPARDYKDILADALVERYEALK